MHEEIKDLTLDQVRAWDAQTFPELIEQLERLPEKAYLDAAYFEPAIRSNTIPRIRLLCAGSSLPRRVSTPHV